MTEQLPPDVIAQLAALDPEITPQLAQASWALLTPFHEKAGYTAPKIDRDLAYGDDPRHRLDVHTDRRAATKAASRSSCSCTAAASSAATSTFQAARVRPRRGVGGPARLRRRDDDLPAGARARVARRRAGRRRGGRLAPAEHRRLRRRPGQDRRRGQLGGRGARRLVPRRPGRRQPRRRRGARAALRHLRHDTPAHRGEPEHVYYGADASPAASSLPGLLDCPVPLLFSVAERDPDRFQREAAGVVAPGSARHGTVPDLVWVEGHNHMSTIASLTVDEPALGTALARFIERHTSQRKGDRPVTEPLPTFPPTAAPAPKTGGEHRATSGSPPKRRSPPRRSSRCGSACSTTRPSTTPGSAASGRFYGTATAERPRFILEHLQDLGDKRLKAMDDAGIDRAILSLTSPGAQPAQERCRQGTGDAGERPPRRGDQEAPRQVLGPHRGRSAGPRVLSERDRARQEPRLQRRDHQQPHPGRVPGRPEVLADPGVRAGPGHPDLPAPQHRAEELHPADARRRARRRDLGFRRRDGHAPAAADHQGRLRPVPEPEAGRGTPGGGAALLAVPPGLYARRHAYVPGDTRR